jgi:mevalonate kinase
MNFDYNQFTKTELVEFLNKHGDDFKYITKPYLIILEEKIENTHNKIDGILEENALLIEKLEKVTTDKEKIKISMELDKNHALWNKLILELDKLANLAYRR